MFMVADIIVVTWMWSELNAQGVKFDFVTSLALPVTCPPTPPSSCLFVDGAP